TSKMHREDGKRADDVYENTDIKNTRSAKEITDCNATRTQSSKHTALVVFIDGWMCHQSSLYFFSSEMKNWTESRRYCRERGADLIIINNRGEEVSERLCVSVWIGLTDSDEEGRWKWVDGSTLTSGFWTSGEPNSYMGLEEDCVVASYGWNDCPCNGAFRWICEKTIF
uniref:C-type lectin domain-containing protein n=1 Tax=Cyprinus carpio TaxID=7962 RepID=A0A8C2CXF6_CYPCA